MAPSSNVSMLISRAIEIKGWSAHQFAREADIAVTTAYRWLKGQSSPEPSAWPELETLLSLKPGSFLKAKQADIAAEYEASKSDAQSKSPHEIDPDQIAAYGDLKEEDRPAMARLLEQILDQQAKIAEHLDTVLDEIAKPNP